MAAPEPHAALAPRLVWLDDPCAADAALVGGKAHRLHLLAGPHLVPPGFCVTATCEDPEPAALADAYRLLGELLGEKDPLVAVRSSGVDEDGVSSSFAGQFETVLGARGLDEVMDAIGRCRASARSGRALEYRRQQRLAGGAPLAVLVQALVPADISVVAFSANPVTGARDEVVVNASWGLGESIVGGSTTPDTFVVRRSPLSIVSRTVGAKERMTVLGPGGTREVAVPRLLRERLALSDAQATEVAALAEALEAEAGFPVDLEGAYQGGSLYLLQCRPITTLAAVG